LRTNVAVGVIYNKPRDKVLLALRPDSVAQGGLWEFPGGKLLPEEGVEQALARELFEELGLKAMSSSPLITIDHDYPDLSVTLHVLAVTNWNGTISGREGQTIEWVPLRALSGKNFPEANRAIIAAARLPDLYLITPDIPVYDGVFLEELDGILRAGVRLLQFRCKQSGLQNHKETIKTILEICNKYNCKLIINGAPGDVIKYRCHGVHLTSELLLRFNKRPMPHDQWVAASCHNRKELEHACRIGVDFAVLSPVQSTTSHPDTEPMGWSVFSTLTRCSSIPVYSLGGMNAGDIWKSRVMGGQGIAMISGIWDARDKVAVVRRILKEKFEV